MGDGFSDLDDFPHKFYYGDLRGPLGDLRLTKAAIDQIIDA